MHVSPEFDELEFTAEDDSGISTDEELSLTALDAGRTFSEELDVVSELVISSGTAEALELESSPQAMSPNAAIIATELIVKTLRFMLYSPFALPCRGRQEFVLAVPALEVTTVLTDP